MDVTVKDVVIEGGLPELQQAHSALRQAIVGHATTVAAIYSAAGKLEAAYARAGYVFVRVAVPPQRIERDGVLRIAIVDGTVEAVDDEGVPQGLRGFVRARLAGLVDHPYLRLGKIERRLLLAGSAAGLTLHSALRPGSRSGTTRLVVSGEANSVHASLDWDNSLPAAIGGQMLAANAEFNNLLGRGEQIAVTVGRPGDPGRLARAQAPYAMIGGTVGIPLGTNGLMMTVGYLNSRTIQSASASYLTTRGTFARTSAFLSRSLVLGHDSSLTVSLGADAITQRESLPFFSLLLARDSYLSARIALQGWRRFADGSSLSGEIHYSQGLAGRGPATTGAVAFSQAGGRSDYSRLDARLAWRAMLDRATTFSVMGHGQTSFGQPLLVSEKLPLASPDGISATTSGGIAVDSGLVLRDELARTITIEGLGRPIALAPYAFSSLGLGRLEQPGNAKRSFGVQALGAGARLMATVGAVRTRFALEYGRCLCAQVLGTDDKRFNFFIGLSF